MQCMQCNQAQQRRRDPRDQAVLEQPPRTIHQPRHLAPQPARVAKSDGPFQLLTRQNELPVKQHRGVHSQPWDRGRRVVGLGMARGDLRAAAAQSSIGGRGRHQLSASCLKMRLLCTITTMQANANHRCTEEVKVADAPRAVVGSAACRSPAARRPAAPATRRRPSSGPYCASGGLEPPARRPAKGQAEPNRHGPMALARSSARRPRCCRSQVILQLDRVLFCAAPLAFAYFLLNCHVMPSTCGLANYGNMSDLSRKMTENSCNFSAVQQSLS